MGEEPYDTAFPRDDFAKISLTEVLSFPVLQFHHDFVWRNSADDFSLELVGVQSLILNFHNQVWPKPSGRLRCGMLKDFI